MKKMFLAVLVAGSVLVAGAQTSTGKGHTQTRKSARQVRGTGQYHGSKDTTPGSPMGTGGAGGNEMSGSQAGSASESAIQSTNGGVQTNDQSVGSQGSKAKKSTAKKKGTKSKNRRM